MDTPKPTAPGATGNLIRLVFLAGGAVLAAGGLWGYLNPGYFLAVEYWWFICTGFALGILAVAWFTEWQHAGILASLYVVGFSAQLAMKDPFWFQQFRFHQTVPFYLMMVAVALQGLAGAVYLYRKGLFRNLGKFGRTFGWLRIALLALVLSTASKAAMEFVATDDLPRYGKHLFVALAFLGCNLASLGALVVALPEAGSLRLSNALVRAISLPGSNGGTAKYDTRIPYLVATFVFCYCAAISLWSFDGIPHLDGIVYLFHARYFLDGVIAITPPEVIEAFDHYLMRNDGTRWYSVNMPGWPAAMAISLWLGVPALLNPVLAGVSVVLLHRFVRTQIDWGTANLIILLLAVSPWYLSISSTMLLHTFTYALVLGCWTLLQAAQQRPSFILPFLGGCLMGWLFLSRPLEGVYVGMLTGLWTVTFLHDRRQWRTVLGYGVGCLSVGLLLFAYNTALTGSPLTMPMTQYLDELWGPGRNAIGFSTIAGAPGWGNVDVFEGHSPFEALINLQQNLYELNSELFGWAGASLFFATAYFLWGQWNRFAAAMAVILVATILIYSFYWYVGGFYTGPRYWFMTLVPVLVFSALGMGAFIQKLDAAFPDCAVPAKVGILVAFLGLTSAVVFESWLFMNKFPGINGYHADYLTMSRRKDFQNGLVFIRSEKDKEYGSAFWLNDFSRDAKTPLFARDLGPERNREVAKGFPERRIFFVDGRSVDEPVANVRAGPLEIDALN